MKNLFLKSIFVFALLALVLCAFCACGNTKEEIKEYNVVLSCPEGVTVTGANPVTVKHGGTATFNVTIPEGYVFKSCEGAEYNQETGILTVSNVTSRLYLEFLIEKYDYDVTEKFTYVFSSGSDKDKTDVAPGRNISSGTLITVTAGDNARAFVGWTIGASYANGGKIVSTSRTYSIRISPETVTNGVLNIFSNYVTADTVTYNANGGVINTTSDNITHNTYYSVSVSGSDVSVLYGSNYLSYMECASSFYDDGTFTRDGYVLIEYNTKPDGTGTSYSLGSKVPMVTDGVLTTLYCIWAKDSDHSDFTYETNYQEYLFNKSATAPHWVEDGITITSYKGNDATVVVPEKIDGKYVTAIASGAFNGKSMETLVLSRRMLKVADGAIVNCTSLKTIYFPDGIYEMNNEALDSASYKNLTNLYVNATLAPRYVSADTGALSVKLSRLLASENEDRVIIIGGSSSYQGIGTEYLEALLSSQYRVINLGTTRTTNGIMYLEAMGALAHEGDLVVYIPENSSYMFGETELYWKTLRDLESMNNIYRYVDISNYSNVFGAFTDFNRNYRYNESSGSSTPHRYEEISTHGSLLDGNGSYPKATTNKYGDYLYNPRESLSQKYNDAYFITMNERVKSKDEGWWNDTENQHANKDYTDPNNKTWCSITDPYFKDQLNRAINVAKSSGAKVYFGFCPADASALVDGAEGAAWLAAYDNLILNTYSFDGLIGTSADYVYDHSYFYDCAFHLNDTGRALRTYQLYLDLCDVLEINNKKSFTQCGTDFDGCLFENDIGIPDNFWHPTN